MIVNIKQLELKDLNIIENLFEEKLKDIRNEKVNPFFGRINLSISVTYNYFLIILKELKLLLHKEEISKQYKLGKKF